MHLLPFLRCVFRGLVVVLFVVGGAAASRAATWTNLDSTGGFWTNDTQWSGPNSGYPDGSGSFAVFRKTSGVLATMTNDVAITNAQIRFAAAANTPSWRISSNASGGVLYLDGGSKAALIEAQPNGGAHKPVGIFSIPVVLLNTLIASNATLTTRHGTLVFEGPVDTRTNTLFYRGLASWGTNAGIISGEGRIVVDMNDFGITNGRVVMTANNTYTGGTTISNGILQLGNGGSAGWVEGNITNLGTLAFHRTDVMTFTNLITGAGTVLTMGNGNTLNITNGGQVSASVFQLGAAANSTNHLVQVLSGGVLEAGSILVVGSNSSVQNKGGIYLFNVNAPTITPSNEIGGAVKLNGGTLVFREVAAAALDGQIMNITYSGSNTLRLASATNASLASYTVGNGSSFAALDLAGTGSVFRSTSLNVTSGGALVGAGALQSVVVSNAGVIAPGHSPGTLTFSNDLTLLDSSLLVLEIAGTNALGYDRLVVGNAFAKNGTVLVTNLGWTFAQGDTFDFFDAASVSGAFDMSLLPDLGSELLWDTSLFESQGILSVTAIPEPGIFGTMGLSALLYLFLRRRRS